MDTERRTKDKRFMLGFEGMVCFIKKYDTDNNMQAGLLLNPVNAEQRMNLLDQVYGWVPIDIAKYDPWAGRLPPLNEAEVLNVDELINEGWMVD